jgi:hypothetical protein
MRSSACAGRRLTRVAVPPYSKRDEPTRNAGSLIANQKAVVVLGRLTLFDHILAPVWIKIIVCVATIALLWKFKKLPEPVIVAVAALVGVVAFNFAR